MLEERSSNLVYWRAMATKRLELSSQLSVEELKERMRRCKVPQQSRRWQVLWHLRQDKSTAQTAQACGFSTRWMQKIAGRFNKEGEQALTANRRPHRRGLKPLLTPDQQQELSRALLLPVPEELGGGLWTGRKVALWIKEKTGRETWPQQGCVYLHRLGFSLKVPRPRHPRAASKEEAKEWEKKSGRASGLHSSGAPGSRSGTLGRG